MPPRDDIQSMEMLKGRRSSMGFSRSATKDKKESLIILITFLTSVWSPSSSSSSRSSCVRTEAKRRRSSRSSLEVMEVISVKPVSRYHRNSTFRYMVQRLRSATRSHCNIMERLLAKTITITGCFFSVSFSSMPITSLRPTSSSISSPCRLNTSLSRLGATRMHRAFCERMFIVRRANCAPRRNSVRIDAPSLAMLYASACTRSTVLPNRCCAGNTRL